VFMNSIPEFTLFGYFLIVIPIFEISYQLRLSSTILFRSATQES